MKYYSTKDKSQRVDFRDAVLRGIAPDGGLYIPVQIPRLEDSFFDLLPRYSLQQISFEIIKHYINDISKNNLQSIIEKAINFKVPLVRLAPNISFLELFHGPTLAFKDFGARFLATVLSHYMQNIEKEIIILVATSGDTGSAVANGFYGIEGIKVFLLYPGGKVSWIQEQQLTTMDKNIYAFEVNGTFDDCQNIVKSAFLDRELSQRFYLSSANSINIARLLPQSFYYFYAFAQLEKSSDEIIFSVPSGNFGNLTAGVIAKKMGLPIDTFIAAVNINDVFLQYLRSGIYNPRNAIKTLSNAMDVGNPSNFYRIIELYGQDIDFIKSQIQSWSISDTVTIKGIQEVYQKYKYILDPHGAVAYQAVREYIKYYSNKAQFVILETAHPAKFLDIVKDAISVEVKMPQRLAHALEKEKHSIKMKKEFKSFKSYILDSF